MKNKAIQTAIEGIEKSIRRKLTEEELNTIKLVLSILWLDARTDCLAEIKQELF